MFFVVVPAAVALLSGVIDFTDSDLFSSVSGIIFLFGIISSIVC